MLLNKSKKIVILPKNVIIDPLTLKPIRCVDNSIIKIKK